MLLKPDCILCLYKVALLAIREFTADERRVQELISDILHVPSLRSPEWTVTSPEVFEAVFRKIGSLLDAEDPFRFIKERQNRKGLEFYPWLKTR